MTRSNDNKREFYVVQFIELPFEGIDDYVCVPYSWLVKRRVTDQKASVAYPKDENPFDTRDRVKRKERYDDEWRCYMAAVKFESDSHSKAEFWLATRNDYGPIPDTQSGFTLNKKLRSVNQGHSSKSNYNPWEPQPRISIKRPLVEEESKIPDTQSGFTLYKKLHSVNQGHSSKSNYYPWEPQPRISIKRPALSEPKKQLDGKRLKMDEAAQPSTAAVNGANAEPGCSNTQQSIIIEDNQSMECEDTNSCSF